MEKVIVEKTTWFITEGGNQQYFGKLEAGQAYETSETVHTFEDEESWNFELKRLGLKTQTESFSVENMMKTPMMGRKK